MGELSSVSASSDSSLRFSIATKYVVTVNILNIYTLLKSTKRGYFCIITLLLILSTEILMSTIIVIGVLLAFLCAVSSLVILAGM